MFHLCAFVTAIAYSIPTQAAFVEPLRSKQAMVVSAHPLASQAGLDTLRRGGNAVDAAVATAFALSVVEPFSAGIGGGGFALLYQNNTGEMKALDFRERAPQKATRNMYVNAQGKVNPKASVDGYLSVAVPGTVAGLYQLHRQYGKLPWSVVVLPAILYAQDGFVVSEIFVKTAESRKEVLLNNPAARKVFTRNGKMYQPGDKLVQRDLARTLREISRKPQSFYTGRIAKAIAQDMAKNGGLITLEDLKSYKPIWRQPICGNFRMARVCSMPPPSSGGVHLLQILNIIGDTDLKALGWHHPDALHLLVEAMKIAYADRSEYLGDPDFVKVPVQQLISPAYAKYRRREIAIDRAQPSNQVEPVDKETLQRFSQPIPVGSVFPDRSLEMSQRVENNPKSKIQNLKSKESPDTTHLTVVDQQRNAVSLTFTINYRFGSGVVTPGTGILLNDEMDDFAAAPGVPNVFGLVGGEANAIAPRKTPLSSMAPTIVTENGRLRLATGSPGGSTIITTVLQIVLNVLEYSMDAGAAVAAPRIHHQWLPERLQVEPLGLDALTLEVLRRRGHQIQQQLTWGNANAIVVAPDNWLEGAADPRGEGIPKGF